MGERVGGIYGHRGDDPIVRAIHQIVQIAGRDGSEYGQLGRGIVVAEHVQRPVANGRPSKMRVVEAPSEIGFERDGRDPGSRCSGQLNAQEAARFWGHAAEVKGIPTMKKRTRT
jgi:hypothetical protein